jgi:hypothetical protein
MSASRKDCCCNDRNIPETADLLWVITCQDDTTGECNDTTADMAATTTTTTTTTVAVEMIYDGTAVDASTSTLLFNNFERCGWSPIRVRWQYKTKNSNHPDTLLVSNESVMFDSSVAQLPTPPSKSSMVQVSYDTWQLLCQYRCWKQLHADLFQTDYISQYDKEEKFVRYIPSESGAAGTSTAEAKQSWEYQRTDDSVSNATSKPLSDVNRTNSPTPFSPLPRLKAWTELLHTVIRHIMVQLQLPTTHLIVQNSSMNDEPEGAKSTPTSQPLDILRAFRYEPIHVDTSGTHHTKLPVNESQLGSSPHTDWGSWTVVWQDDTNPPCLQTYCHHCQKWNSIPSPSTPLSPTSMYDDEIDDNTQTNRCSNLSNEAYFIVHVGDLTSLSIRQAIHQLSLACKSSNTIPIADIWPSPRHRVLLPINQYRHSLVYFVYPPNTTTPALITESLLNWCRRNYFKHMDDDDDIKEDTSSHRDNDDDTNKRTQLVMNIPWDCYSLLSDQSASSNSQQESLNHQLRWVTIQQIQVWKILHDKWKQVQR